MAAIQGRDQPLPSSAPARGPYVRHDHLEARCSPPAAQSWRGLADYSRGTATARSINLTSPRLPNQVSRAMKRLARRHTRTLPLMMAELLTASWETVARRT